MTSSLWNYKSQEWQKYKYVSTMESIKQQTYTSRIELK